MRGVYTHGHRVAVLPAGSSPHARGLRTGTSSPLTVTTDHPRMRGVYVRWTTTQPGIRGSSPHARGLLAESASARVAERIIPACAGFTGGLSFRAGSISDHPRMRGVYHALHNRVALQLGSSPHARGLLAPVPHSGDKGRIIPACAGFTSPMNRSVQTAQDHPRMRGVYPVISATVSPMPGSSPHARGLRRLLPVGGGGLGIIPACAGFTAAHCVPITLAGDHPRMRGVYCAMPLSRLVAWGSSPHARGLRLAILGIPTVLESTTPRFPSLLT